MAERRGPQRQRDAALGVEREQRHGVEQRRQRDRHHDQRPRGRPPAEPVPRRRDRRHGADDRDDQARDERHLHAVPAGGAQLVVVGDVLEPAQREPAERQPERGLAVERVERDHREREEQEHQHDAGVELEGQAAPAADATRHAQKPLKRSRRLSTA